jgi:hypothetical protein
MERRSEVRLRSFLGARIAFNKRSSTMDCLVRNITERGAKLAVPDTVTIPSEFDLSIPHRGIDVQSRMIWRSAAEIGVEFAAGPRGGDVIPLGYARRLHDCEKEKAALKEQVAQLSSAD